MTTHPLFSARLRRLLAAFGCTAAMVACDGGGGGDDDGGRSRSAQPLAPVVLPAAGPTTLGEGLQRPGSRGPVGPLADVDVDGSAVCVVDAAQTLWCWRTVPPRWADVFPTEPVKLAAPLAGDEGFVDVEVERGVACGITTRGAVWCFGDTVTLPTATVPLEPRLVVDAGAARVYPATLGNTCWRGANSTALNCVNGGGTFSVDVGVIVQEFAWSDFAPCVRGDSGVACLTNGTWIPAPGTAGIRGLVAGDRGPCVVDAAGDVRCTPGLTTPANELVRNIGPVASASSTCVVSPAGDVRCGVPWEMSGVCASGVDRVVATGRFGCGHRTDGSWICFGGARGPAGTPVAGLVEGGFCTP
jgi:hypothetical protein